MTDEDRAWTTNWLRHSSGDWGKGRLTEISEEAQLRLQLQRMQRFRPAAFAWLVANDERAYLLARRMQLLQADASESWAAIAPQQVRAKIRAINDSPTSLLFGRFLATALERHAPHHLGLLPPQWLEGSDDQPATVVPLRAAASKVPTEVRRGPRLAADAVIDGGPLDA
jgi:hypothetical protein